MTDKNSCIEIFQAKIMWIKIGANIELYSL